MWTRKTTDPLGRLLFEKYAMHVLDRPRENVSVFDVFPVRDGVASMSGSIDSFLRSVFDRPEVVRDEVLLDIDSTTSDAVSGTLAAGFLQGFLALLGAGVTGSMGAALEASQNRALRFRFGGCRRDHVKDCFELDWKLSETAFDRTKSPMRDGFRYYLATAVHYCNELTFELLDKNMGKVDLSAEVAALGQTKAGLSINREREIVAHCAQRLAYGIELNELVCDERRGQLQLQESLGYVHIKAGGAPTMPRAMIGSADESMVLRLDDPHSGP